MKTLNRYCIIIYLPEMLGPQTRPGMSIDLEMHTMNLTTQLPGLLNTIYNSDAGRWRMQLQINGVQLQILMRLKQRS